MLDNIEIHRIHQLLDDSTKALNSYQNLLAKKEIESAGNPAVEVAVGTTGSGEEDSEDSLSGLVMSLIGTSLTLQKMLKHRAVPIDGHSLDAMSEALEQLTKDPSTQNKVLAASFAIFGYNIPLYQVLKDVQQLLHTVKGLKVSRGERAADVDNQEGHEF